MTAGLAVTAGAESFADVVGSRYEEAVTALAGAGIVSGRGEGLYAPEESLTRAEMASIVVRAFGASDVEPIEKFKDVPPEHWAYKYVETAYLSGIVSGMTETTFEPDSSVTYEQAVKMLVSAMGKDKEAREAGGWPNGYLIAAEESGVLAGVDGAVGKAIGRGQMAQLVYNCINAAPSDDYMIDWDGVAEEYDWMRDEKIRCTYGHSPMTYEDETGVLKRLENAGINCVFLNISDTYNDVSTMDGWKASCEAAIKNLDEKYNLHDFIKINFGDNGVVKNNAYGTFHPGIYKASYFNSPCPLADEYWEGQILERTKFIAGFESVEGIILDFEMYSGGVSQYTSPCMCDRCWNNFVEAEGLGSEWAEVEITERSAYVQDNGKKEAYEQWFEDSVAGKLTYIREETRKVNPKIIFGYFPAFEWLPGMTKGLGTPEQPVIVASENEYWGSLANTKETMQTIKNNEDMHAIYCVGLYPGVGALSPEQLEEKIKQAAPTTGGYWMYSAHLLREVEGNYAAIENGNKDLDRQLETGELTGLPEYEIREYTASKIAGEEPTDAEWEAADFTEDFVNYQNGEDVYVESRAKILYSDEEFFVRIYSYDDMSTVNVGSKQAWDGNPWAGDCVEFFWRFDGTSDAAQLVSDLAGSCWDAYCSGVASKNANVNFDGFSAETELFDDHWEMTMRVPGTLDGVKKIQTGDILRIEIGRYHPASRAAGLAGNHCWAPTYGSYLGSPSIWGKVVLG